MQQMTATSVLRSIRESAEAIMSAEPQDFPEAASPGDGFRQGDLYIECVKSVPKGWKPAQAVAKLAIGETKGSNHVLASLDGVAMLRSDARDEMAPFRGPCMVLSEPNTITHPEHGHLRLPAGTYCVTYQRNLDAMDRAARACD